MKDLPIRVKGSAEHKERHIKCSHKLLATPSVYTQKQTTRAPKVEKFFFFVVVYHRFQVKTKHTRA